MKDGSFYRDRHFYHLIHSRASFFSPQQKPAEPLGKDFNNFTSLNPQKEEKKKKKKLNKIFILC